MRRQPVEHPDAFVDAVSRFRPHVILLDLALPDMSGFDVLDAVSAKPKLQPVVSIAMTGFGDEATARRVKESRFRAHFVKPIDMDELWRLLGEVAQRDADRSA